MSWVPLEVWSLRRAQKSPRSNKKFLILDFLLYNFGSQIKTNMDIILIDTFLKFTKVKRIKREGDIAAYYPTGVRALQVHQLPSEFINWFNSDWHIRRYIEESKPKFFRIEEFWNDLGSLFIEVLRLLNITNIRRISKDRQILNRIVQVMNGEVKNELARRIAKDKDYFEKGHFMGQAMTKSQVLNILKTWTFLNLREVERWNRPFAPALGMDELEDGHKVNKSFTNYLMRYLVWNTQKLGFILKNSEKEVCLEKLILFIIQASKKDSHGIKNTFISFTRQKKGKQRIGAQAGEHREGRPGLWVPDPIYRNVEGRYDLGCRKCSYGDSFVTFSNRTKKASKPRKGKKTIKAKRTNRKNKD